MIEAISRETEVLDQALRDYRSMTMRLPVGLIQFDRYQREPIRAKVAKIAANWHVLGMGDILVSQREDGSFWGMDGQHRVLGTIQKWGVNHLVDAKVYQGLSYELEALVFALVNTERGPVSAIKKYHARWLAKDPQVTAMVGILQENEVPLAWNGDTGMGLVCFATVHDVMSRGGEAHLRNVMRLISNCWQSDMIALQALFIKGLSIFIRAHEKDAGWDEAEAIRCFSRVPAVNIEKMAKEYRHSQTVSKPSAPYSLYWALYTTYNKGRRSRRLENIRAR